jgi:cation diffusion facilitator CzcD-associated flavoprotein CzcO
VAQSFDWVTAFFFVYLIVKQRNMSKNVVIVGAGVAGVNAATKLIDNNFDGKITIIDMGKNPYERPYEDVNDRIFRSRWMVRW